MIAMLSFVTAQNILDDEEDRIEEHLAAERPRTLLRLWAPSAAPFPEEPHITPRIGAWQLA
jgi:hypothetical protein